MHLNKYANGLHTISISEIHLLLSHLFHTQLFIFIKIIETHINKQMRNTDLQDNQYKEMSKFHDYNEA